MQDETRLVRPSGRFSSTLTTAQVPLKESFTFPVSIKESIVEIQRLGAGITVHRGSQCMIQKVKVNISHTYITSTKLLLHS